jgi:hypothetical protein
MKKYHLLPFILCFFGVSLFAQTKSDKLFTQNEVKEVNVKEITAVAIRYTYSGEETVYSINKILVNKIEFASGRQEVFQEIPKYINDLDDYQNVFIATDPSEVLDLEQLGLLNTAFYKMEPLTTINQSIQKPISKLKLEAAMLGANVVLIENVGENVNTNYFNYNYGVNGLQNDVGVGAAFSTVNLSYVGMAFRSNPLEIDYLKSKISNQEFHLMTIKSLPSGNAELQTIEASKYSSEGRPVFDRLREINEVGNRLFVSSQGISKEFHELEVIDAGEDYVVLSGQNNQKISNFYLYTKSYIPSKITINVSMTGN